MADNFETILYEVDGPVATITMNRPDMANAQDSTLIDELDAAFDLADADDAVRVVILAGAGKHFSSGHDLKALVSGDGSDPWVALRETPEGKFQHEKTMYYDRCMRIHDFRKPTIAAVQGSCVAAGLMLAAMCDLIVAADDAVFSNPVLRLTGAGVELLVEPWELGIRKAKEFLLHRRHHRRPGGVAPGPGQPGGPPGRARGPDAGAGRPDRARPAGHGPDGQGQPQPDRHPDGEARRAASTTSWPTTGSTTQPRRSTRWPPARQRAPCARSWPSATRATRNERPAARDRWPASASSMSARGSPLRSAPACWASSAPTSSRWSCPARATSCAPSARSCRWRTAPTTRSSGPSRGGAGGASPATCASPRARSSSRGWWRPPTCCARTSAPGPWSAGASGRPTCRTRSSTSASASSDRPGLTRRAPDSTGSASPSAGCSTSRATPIARPCGPASPSPTTSRAPSPPSPRWRRSTAGTRKARGATSSMPRSTARSCASWSGRWRGTTSSASCASVRGTDSRTSAPLDNYPTADGYFICIVAGSDANFHRLCAAMDRRDLIEDPRFAHAG